LTTAILYLSIFHHKRNLLVRFDRKNASTHSFAGFANILVFGASDFETFHNAGLHPLTDIMTGQLKTLNSSCSTPFNIPPQHLICPLFGNGRDVLYSNPGRRLIWTSPNSYGFAAVRA
jgi:hypothetical protein